MTLAEAMEVLAIIEGKRALCLEVAPERVPTFDAIAHYWVKIIALLTRKPVPDEWDRVLLSEWSRRSNDLILGFKGGVH